LAEGGSLGSLFIIYFYWAPYVVMMTVVNANTGGYTKKTVVYGLAYAGYLVGNIVWASISPKILYLRRIMS
jgi:ACS family allantoate permease-like MFS transporter